MSTRGGTGRMGRVLLPLLIAAPVAVLMVGQLGLFSGQRPQDLGVSNGRLKAPSETRNSVREYLQNLPAGTVSA